LTSEPPLEPTPIPMPLLAATGTAIPAPAAAPTLAPTLIAKPTIIPTPITWAGQIGARWGEAQAKMLNTI
ncbi:MAG: hypothetical protein Q8O76_12050, partial [Chloroflexota bacterium]|nr:hypothetical protein [Chloroflexota bacterium]